MGDGIHLSFLGTLIKGGFFKTHDLNWCRLSSSFLASRIDGVQGISRFVFSHLVHYSFCIAIWPQLFTRWINTIY